MTRPSPMDPLFPLRHVHPQEVPVPAWSGPIVSRRPCSSFALPVAGEPDAIPPALPASVVPDEPSGDDLDPQEVADAGIAATVAELNEELTQPAAVPHPLAVEGRSLAARFRGAAEAYDAVPGYTGCHVPKIEQLERYVERVAAALGGPPAAEPPAAANLYDDAKQAAARACPALRAVSRMLEGVAKFQATAPAAVACMAVLGAVEGSLSVVAEHGKVCQPSLLEDIRDDLLEIYHGTRDAETVRAELLGLAYQVDEAMKGQPPAEPAARPAGGDGLRWFGPTELVPTAGAYLTRERQDDQGGADDCLTRFAAGERVDGFDDNADERYDLFAFGPLAVPPIPAALLADGEAAE